uniref:Putative secreted protein n=1 Tax=Anopheles darlingi TaxID=43151 RepID=A0A2M4DPX4_ANODA
MEGWLWQRRSSSGRRVLLLLLMLANHTSCVALRHRSSLLAAPRDRPRRLMVNPFRSASRSLVVSPVPGPAVAALAVLQLRTVRVSLAGCSLYVCSKGGDGRRIPRNPD